MGFFYKIYLDFTQGWVSSGRNRFLLDIRKKLEERGFFHFLPFLPEETWKKVEETPKCQLGTIIKFAVKGFLCILIQLYRFGWIFTLNWNKMLHFPLNITNFSVSDTMFITFFYIFQISIHSVMKIHEYQYQESNTYQSVSSAMISKCPTHINQYSVIISKSPTLESVVQVIISS